MHNTVCKRIAKSFDLQRYIPEYQVYELCINWESEIPVPPTIFYLSEIFIYPYTLPEPLKPIKKELPRTLNNNTCIDSKTKYDLDISSSLNNRVSHSHMGSLGVCPFEEESKSEKSENTKVLNYDELMSSSTMMHGVKVRNKMIVKHTEVKTPAEGRKRRKTWLIYVVFCINKGDHERTCYLSNFCSFFSNFGSSLMLSEVFEGVILRLKIIESSGIAAKIDNSAKRQ